MPMSQEAFEQFLQDVERQIDETYKASKEKAENTLNAVAGNYKQKIIERIAIELTAVDECRKIGDDAGARRHTVLAEVYKSLFNVHPTPDSR